MNLYIRLILMFVLVRFKSAVSLFDEYQTRHIVWPNDLDLLGHMNNGRYFTITDLVRIEFLSRAGMWKAMRSRGLFPVMGGETIQFRKSLKPFQRYEIRTNALGWDERFFYVEHRFESRGELCALVLVKVRVIGPNRATPADTLRYLYPDIDDTKMNAVIELWNSSTNQHWAQTLLSAA